MRLRFPRFRFSLLTLLIATVIVGGGIGLLIRRYLAERGRSSTRRERLHGLIRTLGWQRRVLGVQSGRGTEGGRQDLLGRSEVAILAACQTRQWSAFCSTRGRSQRHWRRITCAARRVAARRGTLPGFPADHRRWTWARSNSAIPKAPQPLRNQDFGPWSVRTHCRSQVSKIWRSNSPMFRTLAFNVSVNFEHYAILT